MTSTVIYEGDLRTTCTHLQSSSAIETDAPTDNNGKGERFSPTDLLATSLATCMLTVMGIKARSLGFDLNGIKVDVEKKMKPDPRRVAGINLFYSIPEDLKLSDEHIAMLKDIAINFPGQKSMHPEMEVNNDWGTWTKEKA